MAPAIVHFLVGASLFLVLATPLAARSERVRRAGLWLVVAGGIWALVPDLHHVAPASQSTLRALHESPWANLFAFHFALDHPLVRARSLESTAAAIALFLLAVGGFALAGRADPARARGRTVAVTALGVPVGTALAAAALGGMVSVTGRVDAVAGLVGRDGTLPGVAVILAVSGAASLAVATVVPSRYARRPLAGSLLGLALGLAAWALGVALGLPLWRRIVLGASQPIPFVDWPSLVALALAGALLGAWYPIVRRATAPPHPEQ